MARKKKNELPAEPENIEGDVEGVVTTATTPDVTNGEIVDDDPLGLELDGTNEPVDGTNEAETEAEEPSAETPADEEPEEDESSAPREIFRNIQTPQKLEPEEQRRVGEAILDTMDTIEELEEEKKRDAGEYKTRISEEKSHLPGQAAHNSPIGHEDAHEFLPPGPRLRRRPAPLD